VGGLPQTFQITFFQAEIRLPKKSCFAGKRSAVFDYFQKELAVIMIQHPKKTPVITVLQKPFNDKILICFGIQSVKVHIPKKRPGVFGWR
jgi:hypothetical protein